MADTGNSLLSQQLEAAFAWWREAGVDSDFVDDPVDWIAPPAVEAQAAPRALGAKKPEPVAPPTPAIDANCLPSDLAAFTAWWLAEPLLDEGRLTGRVTPRGAQGAEMMVVVPEPEREDQDQDQLLSGPQGQLLDAMLAAMRLTRAQVYLASALPRHTPMADWTAAATRGMGETLRHHVALAAPQRLIVFGSNVLPLIGHDLPKNGHFSYQFNHDGPSIPLLAAADLGALLARPRAKARFWQQWLDWTGTVQT